MEGYSNPLDGLKIFNNLPGGDGGLGGGNGGMGGSWLVILFLIILLGGGNGLFGGHQQAGNTATNMGEGMIMQGVSGNRDAINQLSAATNMGIDGINSGLSQIAVGLSNVGGDIRAGNQQLASQMYQSVNGLQSAMAQQNFDLSTAIQNCCCNTREAISGVNMNISNQTNVLQNQLSQNAFAMERAFCATNQSIRDSTAAIMNQMSQNRYDDLQRENCALNAKLAKVETQCHFDGELQTIEQTLLAAIAKKA